MTVSDTSKIQVTIKEAQGAEGLPRGCLELNLKNN